MPNGVKEFWSIGVLFFRSRARNVKRGIVGRSDKNYGKSNNDGEFLRGSVSVLVWPLFK